MITLFQLIGMIVWGLVWCIGIDILDIYNVGSEVHTLFGTYMGFIWFMGAAVIEWVVKKFR